MRQGVGITGDALVTEFDANPRSGTFVSMAEKILSVAERTPEAAALVSEHDRITFRDLKARASALSTAFTRVLGEKRSAITVATDDPAEMIIAALAAWMSGCAYLPVDPAGPQERLRHMLTEAETPLVAADAATLSKIPSGPWRHVSFDDFIRPGVITAENRNANTIRYNVRPSDLAYVIYTSGSTGHPKGVAVTQGNLSHLAAWHQMAFDVSSRDRGTQLSALTFDAAILEAWPILAAGATLYIPEPGISLFPERLRDYLLAKRITICFAVTPVAEQLLSLQWPPQADLRFLLTGADTLRTFPSASLPFKLVNNYGPTECTVLATSGVVPVRSNAAGIPSLGKPIARTEIYILDATLQPVPDGEQGQICIAGAGVASGYVGRPDLTTERYITSPVAGSSRLYLTGDLGRKLRNGEIEFCGRLDEQIKLRGYRIEPGEIICALQTHPAVRAAAISTVGNEARKQLAAYVVLASEAAESELRNHLSARLPSYMIPDYFVRLDRLPVTARGKIDRASLPVPDRSNSIAQNGHILPSKSEIESEVALMLKALLSQRKLGSRDNFFRVGGNSLLAAQVLVRVREKFGVDLPLRSIFESPSIASLSEQIEKRIVEISASRKPEE